MIYVIGTIFWYLSISQFWKQIIFYLLIVEDEHRSVSMLISSFSIPEDYSEYVKLMIYL